MGREVDEQQVGRVMGWQGAEVVNGLAQFSHQACEPHARDEGSVGREHSEVVSEKLDLLRVRGVRWVREARGVLDELSWVCGVGGVVRFDDCSVVSVDWLVVLYGSVGGSDGGGGIGGGCSCAMWWCIAHTSFSWICM